VPREVGTPLRIYFFLAKSTELSLTSIIRNCKTILGTNGTVYKISDFWKWGANFTAAGVKGLVHLETLKSSKFFFAEIDSLKSWV